MDAAFASTWTAGPAHCALCCGVSACCCRAAASSALSRGSWLRSRPSQERVCCLEPSWRSWRCSCSTVARSPLGAPAWVVPFLFKLSEQIVRTANLDSKLKVEVCVRTGTKFVSEQGLRLNVRVCRLGAWVGGRAVCLLSPSVARRETSRQEEGRSGATGNVRAPEL